MLPVNTDFAFIVHSRNRSDLPRKFPFLKYLPDFVFDFVTLHAPPFVVSKISGLKDLKGQQKNGIVIGIPMTATQFLENRKKATKKIIKAVKLAKKRGAKYVGLGAMTASLSRGGKDVVESVEHVYITTGRTYTVKNIIDYVEKFISVFNLDRNKVRVAIVGAAGGIGSGVSIGLAKKGYKKFYLIDLERKLESLSEKIKVIENQVQDLDITTSHLISKISECNIVVAATSSPEIVIKTEDVKTGTILINDAQPSDISPEIINNRKDVLVVEGGVLHTESIDCHLNMGLSHKLDIFSCLAETILLSYLEKKGHFSLGDFDNDHYIEMEKAANSLGFSICMQNEAGEISKNKLLEFGKLIPTSIK